MSVVLDRISPEDFYNRLDWLRDDWGDDEYRIAKKLQHLRRMFEHLPYRYYDRALPLLGDLARARIVNGAPWREPIVQLRALVSEWDRNRPPILRCESCGAEIRGERAMHQHQQIFHD